MDTKSTDITAKIALSSEQVDLSRHAAVTMATIVDQFGGQSDAGKLASKLQQHFKAGAEQGAVNASFQGSGLSDFRALEKAIADAPGVPPMDKARKIGDLVDVKASATRSGLLKSEELQEPKQDKPRYAFKTVIRQDAGGQEGAWASRFAKQPVDRSSPQRN